MAKCSIKAYECIDKKKQNGDCGWILEGVHGHHCAYAVTETKK